MRQTDHYQRAALPAAATIQLSPPRRYSSRHAPAYLFRKGNFAKRIPDKAREAILSKMFQKEGDRKTDDRPAHPDELKSSRRAIKKEQRAKINETSTTTARSSALFVKACRVMFDYQCKQATIATVCNDSQNLFALTHYVDHELLPPLAADT